MEERQLREAMKGVRLITIDMDGTALNSKKEFTPRTHRVVQGLIDRGYIIVPATGRSYNGLVESVLGLTGVRYVISANGAFVTDSTDGSHIWEQLIPCQVAAALGDELFVPGTLAYFQRDTKLCTHDVAATHVMSCTSREDYRRFFWRQGFPAPEQVMTEKLGKYIREEGRDIPKLALVFTRPDGFAYYEDMLAKRYPEVNGFRTDVAAIEIANRRTGKGEALRALAEALHIPREQICAFGDNGNDKGMVEYAGIGVAMGNAIDTVREAADYIAGTNDEEGVARFLEEFVG